MTNEAAREALYWKIQGARSHMQMVAETAEAFAEYDATVLADQRERYAALVEAARALEARPHVLQVREDGWGLQHKLSCRPALTECMFHEWASTLEDMPAVPGTYEVLTFMGQLKPYNEPDPAIAFLRALESLGASQ